MREFVKVFDSALYGQIVLLRSPQSKLDEHSLVLMAEPPNEHRIEFLRLCDCREEENALFSMLTLGGVETVVTLLLTASQTRH